MLKSHRYGRPNEWHSRVRRNRGSRQFAWRHTALEPLEERLLLTVSWTGGAGTTNWDTAANWSGNAVPTATDDVSIPNGIAITHSDGTSDSVNSITSGSGDSLSISGGSIAVAGSAALVNLSLLSGGTFTANGPATVNGALAFAGGTLGGSGTVTVQNGATVSISASSALSTVTLDNEGAATWTAGTLSLNSAATFQNDGTFDDQVDGTINGNGTFANTGTFTKSGGTGTTTFSATLDNSGTLDVNSGTLRLTNNGTGTGAFNTVAGTEVDFGGGSTYTLNSGASLGGPGLFTLVNQFSGLTVNADLNVQNFQLNNTFGTSLSGSGSMTVGHDFDWLLGGLGITVNISAGATLELANTASNSSLGSGTINNAGAATYSAPFGTNYSGIFNNTGTFDDQTDAQIGGGTFNNYGTFTKSAGTSITDRGAFNNFGTVNVNSGTLVLFSGTGTGAFNTIAGTGAAFEGGVNYTLNAGASLTGPGLFASIGQFSQLTINTNLSVANLQVNNSFSSGLAGAGTITVTGDLNWLGGAISDIVNVSAGATFELASGSAGLSLPGTINNATAAIYTTTSGLSLSGTFNNIGSFDDRTDIAIGATGTSAVFNNSGTFTKSAGTSITVVPSFNNSGTVNIDFGRILLAVSGTETGAFNTLAGTQLEFSSGVGGANYALNNGVSLNGPGLFAVTGQFTIVTINTNLTTANFQFSGQVLTGPGTFTVLGSMSWTSGAINLSAPVNIEPSATLTYSGNTVATSSDLILNNYGAFIWSSTVNLGLFDAVINSYGTFDLESNGGVFENGATINNYGLFEKTAGAGTSNFASATINNTGTVQVDSGTLSLPGAVTQAAGSTLTAGTWMVTSGATLAFPSGVHITTNQAIVTLSGTGSSFPALAGLAINAGTLSLLAGAGFTTTGNLANTGTITLGPASTLAVQGTYTQGSAGALDVQFGGEPASGQFGQISTTGAAALDGSLGLALVNGFVPANGDAFQVLSFPSQTGSFASINRTSPGAGQLLSVATNPTNVTVTRIGAGADPAVTSISIPASGIVGQNATINYTVQNLDPSATDASSWQDSVYLSLSPTLSASSLLIGRVTESGPLAGGGSYNGTLTAPLPGVGAGQYHVIVVADSRGNVTDTDRSNNTLASMGQINVDDPALVPGTPATGTVASAQDEYYQLTVTAGSAVTLTLNTASAGGAELYVQYQKVPTPSSYDQYAFDPTSATQTITIPGTAAGTYYILIHGREASGAGAAFSLAAAVQPFAITSLGLASGGQGQVTIPINGSQFDNSTTFQLLGSDNTVVGAQHVYLQDNTTVYATFDLTAAAVGQYTVQATNTGNVTTQLAGAFAVLSTVAANLQLDLAVPSAARPNRDGTVTVTYTNTGNTDLVAPILELTADNATLKLASQTSFSTGSVWFLGTSATGPAGIIRPGESGQTTITFQTTNSQSASAINFQVNSADQSQPMDWASQENALQLPTISAAAWPAVFANFVANVGSTVASYNAALATDATYLGQLGEPMDDISQLVAFEFEKANASYTAQTLESVTADDLPAPGMDLTFTQSFLQSISGRYTQGSLGNGWTTNWDISASTDASGDAVIDVSGSSFFYTLQPDGSYQDEAGDHATVTLTTGAYRLVETDGTIYQFNANGTLDYVQDTHGNQITCRYNAQNQLVSLTHSNGDFLTLAYNVQGRLAQLTDSNGLTETYGYDPTGQFLTTYTDRYGTTTYSYITGQSPQQDNAVSEIAYADNTHVYYSYDGQGRLSDQQLDDGQEDQSYAYLSGGNGYTIADGNGNISTYLFDRFGGNAETIDPLGHVTQYQYDSNLNVMSVSGPLGTTESYTYDANGNVTSETDPLGLTTSFTYDANNNLTSYTDAKGNTTSYTYDAQDDLLSTTYANGTQQQYSYNPLGETTQYLNANGQTVHSAYNADGLVAQETFSDGMQYSYTYDARGNLLAATDATGTTTFSYTDPRNPDFLTEVAYPNGTFLKFAYNVVGQRTQMVDQTGFTVNYQYDPAGRLSKLIDGSGNLIVQYTYDAAGNLAKKDDGNGTRTTYTYYADGHVSSITNLAPGHTTVNSFDDYTYDALGNVLSDTSQNGQWMYTYDADSQLIGAVFASSNTAVLPNQNIAYVYDAAGNRISQTVNNVTTTYITNSVNEYTSSTTGGVTTNYQYDADGNMVSDGTNTYSYNILRQLTSIAGPEGTTTNTYDALGNRVIQTINGLTTNFMFDPTGLGNVVATFNGAGALTAHYTYGFGLVSQVSAGGASAYYDFNNIGSTVGITGASGTYVNQYAYVPFGQTITLSATLANPFTFVGQYGVQNDGGGLYNMRAREYNAATGQFASSDFLGLASGATNIRTYAANSPVILVDEGGNESNKPAEDAAAAAAAAHKRLCDLKKKLEDYKKNYYQPPYGNPWTLVQLGNEVSKAQAEANAADAAAAKDPHPNLPGTHVPQPNSAGPPGGSAANASGGTSGSDDVCPCHCPANDPNTATTNATTGKTTIFHSNDPNDILGPAGFGAQAFVADSQSLNYTVEFENQASATAPAQTVVLTEQLDAGLDWSTFQLGTFGFGNITVNVTAGHSSYQTIVDDRVATGEYVDVTAGLNLLTGLVTWTFTSLDPTTLDMPANPLAGFLPADVIPPEGLGFVNYSVRPKSSDPTGTVISARAAVVFDTNSPLNTATITNTIDAVAPISSVVTLPATASGASFAVNWSGRDDAGGSGIADYNIFVSIDGGPYSLWQSDTSATSATYTTLAGTHTYAFKSQAIDNVGNVEATHATADATTIVTNGAPQVSQVLVDGTSWTPSYLSALQSAGQGSGTGYAIPAGSAAQLQDLPWTNLNQIQIVFNENVNVAENSLVLTGLNVAQYTIAGFNYTAARFTATWTLTSPIGQDEVLIDLQVNGAAAVTNQFGASLNGALTNQLSHYPTGNGGSGDFLFRFNVLPGDANQDGIVNGQDIAAVASHWLVAGGLTGDFNGDGLVNGEDLAVIASHYLSKFSSLVGDANNDGIVNAQDIAVVASHWLSHGPAGDLNDDGIVNAQDIALIASNWLQTGASGGNAAATSMDSGSVNSGSSAAALATTSAAQTTVASSATSASNVPTISAAASTPLPTLAINDSPTSISPSSEAGASDDAVMSSSVSASSILPSNNASSSKSGGGPTSSSVEVFQSLVQPTATSVPGPQPADRMAAYLGKPVGVVNAATIDSLMSQQTDEDRFNFGPRVLLSAARSSNRSAGVLPLVPDAVGGTGISDEPLASLVDEDLLEVLVKNR